MRLATQERIRVSVGRVCLGVLRARGAAVGWAVLCAVMTGSAALLLANVEVNRASPPLSRPAFALGPVVPGNWLDQQFRVPAGGTARMDIWLGTGDATVDHVPVNVTIFDLRHAEQPLHVQTVRVETTDPRVVSIRYDRLAPAAGAFILRLAPVPGGQAFVAGATKDDRYPSGRLWIGPESAFPDQDLALTVFDRIPMRRWLALTAERQRGELVVYIGLQLAAIMLAYAVIRRIQEATVARRLPISLWWMSVPLGVLLMIPAVSGLSIAA